VVALASLCLSGALAGTLSGDQSELPRSACLSNPRRQGRHIAAACHPLARLRLPQSPLLPKLRTGISAESGRRSSPSSDLSGEFAARLRSAAATGAGISLEGSRSGWSARQGFCAHSPSGAGASMWG